MHTAPSFTDAHSDEQPVSPSSNAANPEHVQNSDKSSQFQRFPDGAVIAVAVLVPNPSHEMHRNNANGLRVTPGILSQPRLPPPPPPHVQNRNHVQMVNMPEQARLVEDDNEDENEGRQNAYVGNMDDDFDHSRSDEEAEDMYGAEFVRTSVATKTGRGGAASAGK